MNRRSAQDGAGGCRSHPALYTTPISGFTIGIPCYMEAAWL